MKLQNNTLACSLLFSIFAVVLSLVLVPMSLGNPNLGSAAVVLAAVLCVAPVGVIVGVVKGVFVSIWTGAWHVEFPAGIGDALMGLLAYRLSRVTKLEYAVIAGQLSRLVFTSSAVALFIASELTLGLPTANIPALQNVIGRQNFLDYFGLAWLAITFPALLISVITNSIISVIIVVVLKRTLPKVFTILRK